MRASWCGGDPQCNVAKVAGDDEEWRRSQWDDGAEVKVKLFFRK